jgi:nucleoside-diphosphate-sugar epimerase
METNNQNNQNNQNELHVIFGTGPLGQATMRELVNKGKRVRMVSRSGSANVTEGVEVVKGDLADPATTHSITKGATALYIAVSAAAYTAKVWAAQWPLLVDGAIDAAATSGAKLIFGDNVYMYGKVTKPMTEDSPMATHTRKGKVRITMAEKLIQAHQAGKIQLAIGRGSDFYGPGVLGSALGDRFFYPLLAGKKATLLGRLDMPHSYTYIEDFGKTLVTLAERPEALGQAWLVPNAPALTQAQVANIAFEEAGKTPQISALSGPMIKALGLFMPILREMAEMSYEYEAPFVVDGSKVERTFGIQPTPLRQGLKNTLDWYSQHPQAK